jgi:hypothetical protein
MKSEWIRRVALFVLICGLVLGGLTGLAIAMLLLNHPKQPGTLRGLAIGSGVAAVIFGVVGNYFRFRIEANQRAFKNKGSVTGDHPLSSTIEGEP